MVWDSWTQDGLTGAWVGVPLLSGGWAVGLLARVDPPAQWSLGYYFGPWRAELPSLQQLAAEGLIAGDATLVATCELDGVSSGRWPIIGQIGPHEQERWPNHELAIGFGDVGLLAVTIDWSIGFEAEASRRRIGLDEWRQLPGWSYNGAVGLEHSLSYALGWVGPLPVSNAGATGLTGEDEAAEWIDTSLSRARSLAPVVKALRPRSPTRFLQPWTGLEMLAAAEVVAAARGVPDDPPDERITEFLQRVQPQVPDELVDAARAAVLRVITRPSDLADQILEEGADEFGALVDDLRARLDTITTT